MLLTVFMAMYAHKSYDTRTITCSCTSAHVFRLPCANTDVVWQLKSLQVGSQVHEQLRQTVVGGHSCDAGRLSLAPASMSHKDPPAESRSLQRSRSF